MEFNQKNKLKTPLLFALGIIALIVTGLLASSFVVHFLVILVMYATLSTAWNWIGGYAGQVSVGHAVFFGIGAYSTALGSGMFAINPWVGTFIGMILSVIFAFLIGIPTFRSKGHYFVIATLAIGEIMFSLFMGWAAVGGGGGYFIKMKEHAFLNFQFKTKKEYLLLLIVFFVMGILITAWLQRSKIGYYLRAIKGDQDSARALGINPTKYKQIAMTMSAAMTALIGAFWANYILFIDPESVMVGSMSTRILLTTVVGGVGTIWGPIIGALIIIPLTEGTRTLLGGFGSGIDMVLYGVLIMIIAIWQPEGIMGYLKALKRKRLNRQKQIDQLREGSKADDVTSG